MFNLRLFTRLMLLLVVVVVVVVVVTLNSNCLNYEPKIPFFESQ